MHPHTLRVAPTAAGLRRAAGRPTGHRPAATICDRAAVLPARAGRHRGAAAHVGRAPPPQVCGAVQAGPQVTVPPQPSAIRRRSSCRSSRTAAACTRRRWPCLPRRRSAARCRRPAGHRPSATVCESCRSSFRSGRTAAASRTRTRRACPTAAGLGRAAAGPAGHRPAATVRNRAAVLPLGQDGSGVHPHTLAVPPPPQVCGALQAGPQDTVPPQPFRRWCRSSSPLGQDASGVHPHTSSVPPPPQVCGALQAGPQDTVPPQPFAIVPQFFPLGQDGSGVQPHTLVVPPPPQVWGAVQAGPQDSVRRNRSRSSRSSCRSGRTAAACSRTHWACPRRRKSGARCRQAHRTPCHRNRPRSCRSSFGRARGHRLAETEGLLYLAVADRHDACDIEAPLVHVLMGPDQTHARLAQKRLQAGI